MLVHDSPLNYTVTHRQRLQLIGTLDPEIIPFPGTFFLQIAVLLGHEFNPSSDVGLIGLVLPGTKARYVRLFIFDLTGKGSKLFGELELFSVLCFGV